MKVSEISGGASQAPRDCTPWGRRHSSIGVIDIMRIRYRQVLLTTFAVLVALALVAPGVGSAQTVGPASDPASSQYGDASVQIQAGGKDGSNTPPSDGPSAQVIGGLPFTGSDLVVLAGAAVVLLGAGLALRRHARVNG